MSSIFIWTLWSEVTSISSSANKEFEKDDIFNTLFYKMKSLIDVESNAEYIPDFTQAFLEFLNRNSELCTVEIVSLQINNKGVLRKLEFEDYQ